MPRKTRSQDQIDGDREASLLAATLGGEVKRSRKRRRLTQRQLAARVGLEQSRMSEIERGAGGTLPLGTWVRIGMALDRPFAASLSRDLASEPRDAGHLAPQELLLRMARRSGHTGLFELPTRPADPSRSTDVGIRDDAHRVLIRVEI
jgi:transcriptional regulator with XRE-family HTH domain